LYLDLESTAMRAGFAVDAVFGDAKALDGTTGDEVFGNNFSGVFGPDVAVPDGVRIDNHGGAVLALVEATGLVDAHPAGEACFFAKLLQARVQIALSVACAGWPGGLSRADIVADEDVTFKQGQACILLGAGLIPE
jgi:hypothetical protein